MKKLTALTLILLLLAACKAPAAETPAPTTEPQSVLERLTNIQPEDIKLGERLILLPGPEPTAEELAPLLREAAKAPLDHGQADFIKNYVWQISFDISGEEPRRSWVLNVGTEENVVWLQVNEEELWLENAGLYRLIRTSDDVYPDIDREAYAKYGDVINANYDRETALENAEEEKLGLGATVAGWELVTLRLEAEREELGLQAYRLRTAKLLDPPEMAPVRLAGGAYVDSQLRLHGGWLWEYLIVVDGEAIGVIYLERELDMSQYATKQEFLEMVKANLADTSQPTPDRGDLTEEEVERVNKAFSYWTQDWQEDSPAYLRANGFFLSHYADVRELNFTEFLRYLPDDGTLSQGDEGEAAALRNLVDYPQFDAPTHRFRRSTVDAVLKKYAGITTRDLADTGGPCYLPEYDAWYNFTSDFGPGYFTCEGGRVTGDTAVLWSGEEDYFAGVRDELTLKKRGESWYIQSFLRVPMDRAASLDAYLLGLAAEEVAEVSWPGMTAPPLPAAVAELMRAAAQNPAFDWEYGGTFWDMTLRLADGERLSVTAGEEQNIVCVSGKKGLRYFRSPALYGLLRTQNDTEEKGIDRGALQKYQKAVDAYLAENTPENSGDVPVHLELTDFYQVGENPALNLQVWCVATVYVADPPEKIKGGNGYVDSDLRFHAVGSDWYNLLVTAEGEALGFWDWDWLETGGLTRYATVEELKEAINGR